MWPKLFRRIVPYLAAGFSTFDGFDAWLRTDPVNRDDELFLLNRMERSNMHDVINASANQIQLTEWPEDFIISPDPAPLGAPLPGHPRRSVCQRRRRRATSSWSLPCPTRRAPTPVTSP
jgi:hypothetical protein